MEIICVLELFGVGCLATNLLGFFMNMQAKTTTMLQTSHFAMGGSAVLNQLIIVFVVVLNIPDIVR